MEMRYLLTDNISLLQQLETFGGQYSVPALHGMFKARLREVMTLLSLLYCFVAYVAMRVTDEGVQDMLAYAQLITGRLKGMGVQVGWTMTGCSNSM